ncbi:MAG TPA: energy transducer TonB [Steroidobacteraceae bacterium]|nr:energy transducer TonB [Steroidobacteraceae bacterium]
MNTELFQVGLPPASDRMLTTLFLAALFHGIVILGVTFSSSKSDEGGPDSPALEVVLVNDQAPLADKNPNARYIAQRTQLGTGNMLHGERTRIPKSSQVPLERLGSPGGEGLAAARNGETAGEEELVATHAPALKILYFAAATAAKEASQMPELLEKRPDLAMTPNDEGIELLLRGESKQQLWIAADTRESDVAVYLDIWRRKIERVGTINFPDVARRRLLSGTPVIEVTIGSDGKLLNTVVRRSSGHAEIDEAAMRILKLASPYDPFPAAMNAKHDEIRIAYEWQFLGGEAHGSSVYYAEPSTPGARP